MLKGLSDPLGLMLSLIKDIILEIPKLILAFLGIEIPWWLQQNSPSPIEKALMGMKEHMKSLSSFEIPRFKTSLGFGNANSIMNFQPTPTSSYTPSAINNRNVSNTINMGGNVVRDDMDLALLRSDVQRTLRNATYGV